MPSTPAPIRRLASTICVTLACALLALLCMSALVASAAQAATFSYLTQITGSETPATSFGVSWYVAVNASGDVWVTDSGNKVVDEFGPTGKYITQITGNETPSGSSFNPSGVAVNASGDVYVAEFENQVVDEFEPTGKYIKQAVTKENGEESLTKTQKTELKKFQPEGVAVNGSGDVFAVNDSEEINVVDEFEPTGKYLRQIAGASVPQGSWEPRGIAVNPGGELYAVDQLNNVVDRFGATGTYIEQFNGSEAPQGAFAAPRQIAVDGSGDVYVAEDELRAGNQYYVDEFSATGKYITQFDGAETPQKEFVEFFGLGVNASGDVYVADREHNVVDEFEKAVALPPPTVEFITPTEGPEAGGTAVKITGTGFVAPATVKIGSEATSVTVVSSTEITATTAATAAGSDEVIVTDAGGTSKLGPSYTYIEPPKEFTLTTATSGTGSGTVKCDTGSGPEACASKYPEGTKVTITAVPAAGSEFTGFSGDCTGTGPCVLTMTADKSVTANFNLVAAKEFTLTTATSGTGSGTVKCDTGSGPEACASKYPEGTKVTITAVPAAGSEFTGFSGDCTGTGPCVLTMTADKSVTANFNLVAAKEFTLTTATSGTGSGTVKCDTGSGPEACASKYPEGTKVTITAVPAAGSEFTGFSGDCTGTGPCVLTMTADKSVTANFNLVAAKEFTLTTATSGTGSGTVKCDTGSGPEACASKYPEGTKVTITAVPAAGSEFTGFSGDCTGTGPCVLTMTADKSVTANFNLVAAKEFTLTTATSGTGSGTVKCDTGSGPEACASKYPEGTKVTITAVPAAGSEFTGFSGDCTGTGPCVLTMTADKSVTANFNLVAAKEFTLTTATSGTGSGTVKCDTGSGPEACASKYPEGTKVTITAVPAAGSEFTGFSGDCTGTGPCVLTMTADKSVTANFNLVAAKEFTLTTATSGTGSGTVKCDTGSGPEACASKYPEGTKVTITAVPAAGSEFTGFSGDCTGTGPCVLTMTADKSVTANFNLVAAKEFTLTTATSGTGSGTVKCDTGSGPEACASKYPEGTKVTITAVPAAGSEFTGFSGDCTGTGPCVLTMTADKSVTANFNLVGTAAPTSITAAPQIVLFPPPYGVGLFKVSATLTSGTEPVAGRPIVFSVGATHLCDAITAATGTASCTLTLQGEIAVLKANSYTASFAGDSSYLASSASTPAIEFGSGRPGHHTDKSTRAAVARVLHHAAGAKLLRTCCSARACFATLGTEQQHPGHGRRAGKLKGAHCSQLFTVLSRDVSTAAAAKHKHS